MVGDAWLLGVAIIATLLAGAALSMYETVRSQRGLRWPGVARPGATALLVGFSAAALVTGRLAHSWFVVPAAILAGASGTSLLRRGNRITSFVILWAMAAVVVVTVSAEIPAYGSRVPDVAFSALVLACFTSVIRELDVSGSSGWVAALIAAVGTTGAAYAIGSGRNAGLALLISGAVFAVVAVSPWHSGMLGRMGSRVAGLIIGALAIRVAAGSPITMAIVVAAGVLSVIGYIATFESPERGRIALGAAAVVVLGGLAATPAALALADVYRPIHRAVATSKGLVNADAGRLVDTTPKLVVLQQTFAHSAARLDKPSVAWGRVVPFLSANLGASTSSAHVAADLADSARQLIDEVNLNDAGLRNGQVDPGALQRVTSHLRQVQADVRHAQVRLGGPRGDELLVPELRTGVADLRTQLRSVSHRIATSVEGTQAAQSMLGFDHPRRYFVAVENSAESRATGGYIANYGILVADNGRVTLPEFRRTSEFDAAGAPHRTLNSSKEFARRYSRFDVAREWTNVNMSPDLPTVARVMADQYRQFSGTTIDGVIAVDPIALAHLLTLTGPVTVPGWPTPITAQNVVKITLHDEYIAYDNQVDNRIDFLGRVAKTVFDRLSNGGLRDLIGAGAAVHHATASRHLQVWTADARTQRFFRSIHAAGAIGPLRGDALMVTTQNAAGNKLDFYLHRDVAYDAKVSRDGDGLRVDATLTVKLRNDAPTKGEPKYVIGPYDARYVAGQNRLFLTVYSPLSASGATLDGQRIEITGEPELGRLAHSAFVDVPAGQTRTVVFHLQGVVASRGRYTLDVVHQPLVYDDNFSWHLSGSDIGSFGSSGVFTHDFHLRVADSGK